jgi:hypothetical protein
VFSGEKKIYINKKPEQYAILLSYYLVMGPTKPPFFFTKKTLQGHTILGGVDHGKSNKL